MCVCARETCERRIRGAGVQSKESCTINAKGKKLWRRGREWSGESEREREDERKREREKVIFNNLLLSSSRNIPILPIETTLASNATD